jgi:DNA-directed RNA polymerase specialized sigma24 family protein
MSNAKQTPYDFIQRNYRDPGGDDPIKRWLPHPENARAICRALLVNGMPEQDLQDGMQDVFVRALTAFSKGTARVPADLREMKAFCANIAKKHAMATLRKAARRERLGYVGTCEADADEYTPLEYGAPKQRDPVDASRQLEVLAQLFRAGRMPEHGVDILEGVAAGCTHEEIALDLKLTADTVEGRMRMMRERYRRRVAKLGLLAGVQPLELLVSRPLAIETLRRAAA